MEARLPTHDTNLAAALLMLGYPGKCQVVESDRTGKVDVTWKIGLQSITNPQLPVCSLLAGELKSGKLEDREPLHPLLEGLRALYDRERLLRRIMGRDSIRLAKVPDAPRMRYIMGDEVAPNAMLGRHDTVNFRFVCAVAGFGIPLISHTGLQGSRRFTITQGSLLPGSGFNADMLAKQLADDTLGPDHPLRYRIKALENHSRLVAYVDRCERQMMLNKPGTQKRAFVNEHAGDAAFEKIQKFFRL